MCSRHLLNMKISASSPNNLGTESLSSTSNPLLFFIVIMVKETEAQKGFITFLRELISGSEFKPRCED